tara:strand:- start:2858 stop:3883 length:1026 start_codon:yes stop_codon:yes gene_type:complete
LATNITFRSGLLGGVTDFCSEVALGVASAENIVELIVLLATYQEEGVELKPKVYLFQDINQIIPMLPDGEKLKIGISVRDTDGLKKVLKKCAPLAKDGWVIYISELEDNKFEYGLLSGSSSPISVDLDDVILDGDDSTKVVRLYQLAGSCVELKSNSSETINVFLNHRKSNSEPPLKYFDSLVDVIAEDVNVELLDTTKNYLSKILIEALEESHGCIVGVSSKPTPPKFLEADGTTFESPINFVELIKKLKKNEIKESTLVNKGTLLKGMFNSDGIILFDRKGQLLGYNYFVNLPAEKGLVGGARKRAFSSLKKKVGSGLVAVFMQSQDGWTDFEGIESDD